MRRWSTRIAIAMGVALLGQACGSSGGGGGGSDGVGGGDGVGGTGGSAGSGVEKVYDWAGSWSGTAVEVQKTGIENFNLNVLFKNDGETGACGTTGLIMSTNTCSGDVVCIGTTENGVELLADIEWKTGHCVASANYAFTYKDSNTITFTCSFAGGTCSGTLTRFL
jgi:hypothetical protein